MQIVKEVCQTQSHRLYNTTCEVSLCMIQCLNKYHTLKHV